MDKKLMINDGIKEDKMTKKLFLMALLVILSIILNFVFVDALGITPGRTNVEYASGLEKTNVFSVLNSENKNIKIVFSVQGELAEYVTLSESTYEFNSLEGSKQFSYSFVLPESLKINPGIHTAEIVVLEVPNEKDGEVYVGATVAVVSQLYVRVAYPGKFVEADLNVLDAEENSSATLIIPVVNRGKLGIGDVRAIVDIYDSFNNKLETIETDYRSLDPGKRTELSGKWVVNVPSGDYFAKVSVFYDGETMNFDKQFAVGTKSLSIESILVNDFRLGEIAKLQILVENRWNQELNNVFANLQVYNDDNQVMVDLTSASSNIPALTKKELIAYWDTIGVEEGEYNGKLMIRYGKKSKDQNLVLEVSQNNLNIFGVGYAISPEGGGGFNITTILVVLIVLLMAINVAWFVWFKIAVKKRK